MIRLRHLGLMGLGLAAIAFAFVLPMKVVQAPVGIVSIENLHQGLLPSTSVDASENLAVVEPHEQNDDPRKRGGRLTDVSVARADFLPSLEVLGHSQEGVGIIVHNRIAV